MTFWTTSSLLESVGYKYKKIEVTTGSLFGFYSELEMLHWHYNNSLHSLLPNIFLGIQNRIVRIENGFQKADHHETGVADLLDKGNLFGSQVELVDRWKVCVGSSEQAIVVEHNQLFVGDLQYSEEEWQNKQRIALEVSKAKRHES
jgi:hypothetical protein